MTVSEVVKNLESMDSKKSGLDYLNKLNLNRSSLVNICKYLDIPKGTIDRMKKDIVENTIGFRLRSKAILEA